MTIMYDSDGDISGVRHTVDDFTDAVGFDAEVDGKDIEFPVSTDLYRWAMPFNYHNKETLHRACVDAVANGWAGIGAMTEPDGSLMDAEVTEDDYGSGRWGGSHLCEVARKVSNLAEIAYALDEAGAAYFTSDNVLFYNLGDAAAVETIQSLERALDGYPLLSDERTSEIEDAMSRREFEDLIPSDIGESVDREALYDAYRGEGPGCPECGGGRSFDEALKYLRLRECRECREWFDPEHPDTSDQWCEDCREIPRDEAGEEVERWYGFDPGTGEGLIVRIYGVDYRFTGGVWQAYTPYANDHIIGR